MSIRNLQFSRVIVTTSHSHQKFWTFHILGNTFWYMVWVFNISHFSRCKWLPHFGFILHFPDDNVEHLFMCILLSFILFSEVSFQAFYTFVIGLFVFSLLNCKSSSILDMIFLSDLYCEYFLPVCGLLLHFLHSNF